mgnify:CR=1 FL=1
MPSSSPPRPGESVVARLWRRPATLTALLTLALAALFALVNWRGQITVRDGAGIERVVPLATIWETFFARLPQRVPGLLGRDALIVGLVVAVLALAYILVATIRLPE